jgi:hypothetical protein
MTQRTSIEEDGEGVAAGAANAAGTGNVEGIGVGPKGEPGVYPGKRKLRSIISRKPLTRLNQSK